MHIRCERCQAEYDLDESQVRGGTDVQCSVCGNVFAVGVRRTPTSLTRRRSSPQAMAVSVPNDDYRGSDVHFPSVDGDTAEAASHEHTHGALKIFVGLTVAAGVAFAGIEWQRGRIHSATIAAKTSAGSSASTVRWRSNFCAGLRAFSAAISDARPRAAGLYFQWCLKP